MIEVETQHLYYLNPGTDVCLVSGEKQYTRRQLLAEAGRTAARYRVSPGDRIAILAENRPEWAAAFFSAWKVKAVAVPIDAMSAPEDAAYILKDRGGRLHTGDSGRIDDEKCIFCTDRKNVSPDDHFEIAPGVDSMSKIELLVSLNEAFGADLKEKDSP